MRWSLETLALIVYCPVFMLGMTMALGIIALGMGPIMVSYAIATHVTAHVTIADRLIDVTTFVFSILVYLGITIFILLFTDVLEENLVYYDDLTGVLLYMGLAEMVTAFTVVYIFGPELLGRHG